MSPGCGLGLSLTLTVHPSVAVSKAKRQVWIGTPFNVSAISRKTSIKVEKQSLGLGWWMFDLLESETEDKQLKSWRQRAERPRTFAWVSFFIYTKLIQRKGTRNESTKRGIGGNMLLLFKYVFCLLKDSCIIYTKSLTSWRQSVYSHWPSWKRIAHFLIKH